MSFDLTAGSPPFAKKNTIRSIHHGIEKFDDYAWLRADNWQAVMRDPQLIDEEIRQHLEAENEYQKLLMKDTEKLQARLVAEMRGRIKEDDSTVPMKDGPWEYGSKYEEGGEHPKFTRLPHGGGKTEILLDGDEEAEGKEYFRIGGAGHSPDHNMLSWSFDDKGSEMFTIFFRDLKTGKDLKDSLPETVGGGVFSSDSSTFIYTRVDENHRPSKLFAHNIGGNSDDDRLIFEEDNPGFFLSAGKTQSDAYIVISTHDHESSQVYLLPADAVDQAPLLIAEREDQMQYSVDEAHGILYILTNRDGAKDFKIVTTPADAPSPDNWTDLVPHKSGRLILAHSVYHRHLVWLERSNGLPRIVIRRNSDGEEHAISFDEEAYSLGLAGAMEFDTDVIRFTYSSMTTPQMTFDYNMETRERTLLKTQEVPSGHDPDNYITRRV
ncbi:MAG: S9 family peptidase, partial [Rhizobiaceae bacterium]